MMKILGIDPAVSSSGWVLLKNNKIEKYGRITTSPEDGKRLLYIYNEFYNLIRDIKPDSVHIETPFFGTNAQTGLNLAYVRGGLLIICESLNIPVVSLAPQEIKKNITGNGRAKKEEVFEKLCEIFKNDEQFKKIGPFSDKNNTEKTSDIYDALAAAVSNKKEVKARKT